MGLSAYWKLKARTALKEHWLTALLIALVVNLPSLLVQGIAATTGNDLTARLQDRLLIYLQSNGTQEALETLQAGIQEILGSTGIWVIQGLNLAAWLMTPCLTLGMTAWLLGRLRGEEDPGVTAVFSRMRLFFAGIGMRLYVALRIFLFMLPGLAASVLAYLPLWLGDRTSRISMLNAANTAMGFQSAAMILTAVLGVMAALKYALADMVLADAPETGPVRAAKKSRELMQGKRGILFSLYLSFLFWYFLELMVSNLCLGMFGPVPALMVQMLASLAISVYVTASVSSFYQDCLPREKPEQEIITESETEE